MIATPIVLFCLVAAAPVASNAAAAGTAAPVAADPYDGAVNVLRCRFENDEDLDFDRQPDGWIRRKGPGFPSYIDAAIDRASGHGGKGQSLRFKANGGRVIMYSKPVAIDPYKSYVFRGFVRTQSLEHDAALVSVSLLNEKRQRVQRFLTKPVTGTHKDWREVMIESIVPSDDVRFVVVGCHLVPGVKMDISGSAWFDDLEIGELPLFTLESNFQTHFREHDSRIEIKSHVNGLDPARSYSLDLQLVDANGTLLASKSFQLSQKTPQADAAPPATRTVATPGPATSAGASVQKQKPFDWILDPQPHGFYAVNAVLKREGAAILTKKTSFAVMDSLSDVADQGEFGWTVKRVEDMPADRLKELAEIASQAGINWLKYPLWRSVHEGSASMPVYTSEFFDALSQRRITPVGLLNDPPADLRRQFARDWTGISEIFTVRTEFWRDSIEKVIARYSSHVRHWQLGQEDDGSFLGMPSKNLAETIAKVKLEFDRIGRDTRIGVHWNFETPLPKRADVRGAFFSMSSRDALKENELVGKLKSTAADAPELWVLLTPLPKTGFTTEQRGSDLVKKMVEAKIGGAEKIFAADVFDEETGLLSPGGSPTQMFLPWRTTAMALQGADFIGTFLLPQGSRNYAFSRKGEVAIVVWNNEVVDEDLFLGDESIVTDVLGRRIPARSTGSQEQPKLRVGPSPLVIRRFPEPVARWMSSVTFEKGRLPSKTGKQREVIRGVNTFRQGVSGTLRILVPKDWRVEPTDLRFSLAAGERFEWPITLELPANTSLGSQRFVLDFAMSPYPFRVYRDYEVGLGDVVLSVADVKLENGDLQIKQFIDNHAQPEENLNFECSLYVPNRKRMRRNVTKLGRGRDTQIYILPSADSLVGKELHLRAQQIGGQRVLNYKWKVGENWDKGKPAAAENRPAPGKESATTRKLPPRPGRAAADRRKLDVPDGPT